MVLVDTSIWIDFLGERPGPSGGRLSKLIAAEIPFALTPIILQEILQGAPSARHFQRLKRNLMTQRVIFPKHEIESHVAAADIYARCRRVGITPRGAIDCLIAQIAIDNEAPLLHNDAGFDRMARIVPELMIYDLE